MVSQNNASIWEGERKKGATYRLKGYIQLKDHRPAVERSANKKGKKRKERSLNILDLRYTVVLMYNKHLEK